ncbi:ABC transporter ATP-binding protein [Actinotalea sp. K2]|uniref:ABC transporter ATP-binding protein n=1 Tax=Actinotalea sp. K2 TaxID=2939438 RepID=UPI002016E03D|nr:ABC transporter ATP-binding protein [Actinotalea sp. K2]MCL3861995.1 ABC transporter ATP-binding protein [Actinotalea sp. K2]
MSAETSGATAPSATPRSGPSAGTVAATAALAGVESRPGASKPDAILVADDVVRRFGGLTAVKVDHLEVQRNVITALIGPNGAGKTTLFNLVTGFDRPSSGTWTFDGASMSGKPAARTAQAGMVRTFQLTKALARMTVIDNMRLGARDQPGENMIAALVKPLWVKREREITVKADELLVRFKLDHLRDEFAGSLSGGQRKLLEMARALMSDPVMIMLDEPMAGVNPALTQSLLGHIRDLRDQGMTVLFVEHDMHMVRHISDWVVVMAEGRIVAEGPPETVMEDAAVIDAYLGAHHDTDLGDDALLADEVIHNLEHEAEAEEENR